jgi:hypothetical protein
MARTYIFGWMSGWEMVFRYRFCNWFDGRFTHQFHFFRRLGKLQQ